MNDCCNGTVEVAMCIRTALVIVVYNQYCGNSVTCKTMSACSLQPDIILVVDNSTREMNNRLYCEEQGWLYHSMGYNAGLTKAYNTAISVLQNKADLIIWADDDTSFPCNYMEKLVEYAANNSEKDIFLPVVRSKTKLLSPAIYTERKMMSAKVLSDLKDKQITAINSGMAVKKSIYDNYRYDERIFLDYVDHDFMCWCRQNSKRIQIMEDVSLFQNFFDEGNTSIAARKNRLKIFCKDYRVFEAKYGRHRLHTEWVLLKYCIRQYLKMLKIWLNE